MFGDTIRPPDWRGKDPSASLASAVIGADAPIPATDFRGARRALEERAILAHPQMALNLVAGVPFEAARLWLQRAPLVPRCASHGYSFMSVPASMQDVPHVE